MRFYEINVRVLQGWAGHVTRMDAMKNAKNILVRRPEYKRTREIPELECKVNNIKMDINVIVCELDSSGGFL